MIKRCKQSHMVGSSFVHFPAQKLTMTSIILEESLMRIYKREAALAELNVESNTSLKFAMLLDNPIRGKSSGIRALFLLDEEHYSWCWTFHEKLEN